MQRNPHRYCPCDEFLDCQRRPFKYSKEKELGWSCCEAESKANNEKSEKKELLQECLSDHDFGEKYLLNLKRLLVFY